MKLTIYRKLLLSYLAMALLTVLASAYAIFSLQQLNELAYRIINEDVAVVDISKKLMDTLIAQESAEKRYLILRDQTIEEIFWSREPGIQQRDRAASAEQLPGRRTDARRDRSAPRPVCRALLPGGRADPGKPERRRAGALRGCRAERRSTKSPFTSGASRRARRATSMRGSTEIKVRGLTGLPSDGRAQSRKPGGGAAARNARHLQHLPAAPEARKGDRPDRRGEF